MQSKPSDAASDARGSPSIEDIFESAEFRYASSATQREIRKGLLSGSVSARNKALRDWLNLHSEAARKRELAIRVEELGFRPHKPPPVPTMEVESDENFSVPSRSSAPDQTMVVMDGEYIHTTFGCREYEEYEEEVGVRNHPWFSSLDSHLQKRLRSPKPEKRRSVFEALREMERASMKEMLERKFKKH